MLKKTIFAHEFRKILASNFRPHQIIADGYYIINTNKSGDKSMGHWLALIKQGSSILYFDSFGLYPIEIRSKLSGYKVHYTTKLLQDASASSCGHYCIAFLAHFYKHQTATTFLSYFGSNTLKNEQTLNNMFRLTIDSESER